MSLFSFWERRNITCPYCMDMVNKKQLKYRCKKCNTEYDTNTRIQNCTEKKDGVLCGGLLTINCSTCGRELPSQIFQFDQYVKFCIVGHTDCGKTNYITVMIREFEQKLNRKLLIAPMNSKTQEIQNDHAEYLYKLKQPVPSTASGSLVPQLYQITDRTRYSKISESYKVYSMTIFDGAGEDYKQMSDTIRRYISGSDYIFFLVDPLKLKRVREQLGLEISTENESKEIVTNMADYLRRGLGLQVGKPIKKPVAVILTKFDEIIKLMSSAQITQENQSAYQGEYLRSDADAIDSEIRSWLESIDEGLFLSTLETNFKNLRFFGVSSYGHPLTSSGSVGTIMPHRVLDPVMWVLSENKIIG